MHIQEKISGPDILLKLDVAIDREQEFRLHEGRWCASCDFQEFYPAKTKNPRPVPTGGRTRQLGFEFDREVE